MNGRAGNGWAAAGLLAAAACPALAQPASVDTEAGRLRVERVAEGLVGPWSLAFLPDGRMLVTEKPGRLRVVARDGTISPAVAGLPAVAAQGQGGLLDVALAPDFTRSRLVYWSFAEAGEGGAGTAVARGRLNDEATRLEAVEVIFRQVPKVTGGNHYGSRLAFSPDGKLFVTLGERFKFEPAQDIGNTLGALVRINPDGSIPPDNPFVGRPGARPEIWSYGHRNSQGAAIHPTTGALWTHEFGPRGGDELNLPQAGRNYGWPLVSWGRHYDGRPIPDPSTRPDLAGSVHHWTPVISPSGMSFYTGSLIPAWRGSILIGGLSSEGIVRVVLNGDRFASEERIPLGVRIRDVRGGPDGAVWALRDGPRGALLRLSPEGR